MLEVMIDKLARVQRFLRRHILWVGFLAVIIPLLIILYLQYSSLTVLEKTLPVVRKEWMKRYLDAVDTEVQTFYRANAEETLSLPGSAITHRRGIISRENMSDSVAQVAYHFGRKRKIEGAKRFFVGLNVASEYENIHSIVVLFYNPITQMMERDPESPEWRAAHLAVAPYMLLIRGHAIVDPVKVVAETRNAEYPVILRPITDESSRIIGVAGMIVDVNFFKDEYLPQVIKSTLPKFFPEETENAVVTVRSGADKLVWATQPSEETEAEVFMPLQFIFTDWQLGMRMRDMTQEQWAERYFAINASLMILMTLGLIGGIVMALRTAFRETRLSQMKADFVSNVSHELRTPLASIRVFAEFLRLGRVKEPDKIRQYGDYIETESRRLTQLINNILDFSKIESGRKEYQFEQADVVELVVETIKTFDARLKQMGFTVTLEPPPTPVPLIKVDAPALVQAFMNIVDNAVKYSGDARQIQVRMGQGDGFVTISVTDHGVGIPPHEQAKIFDRFHRVSTGLVHDVKGSGLGLAIVKHIVAAHHGKVMVDSKPGRGSTFTIHLPLGAAADMDSTLTDERKSLDTRTAGVVSKS